MIGLLGSLLGSQGGRLVGGAIGGRTGAMIGSFAGAMIGGRRAGHMIRGVKDQISNRDTQRPDDNQANQDLTNQDAEVLIRSMVNAAKADGEIDQSEVDAIFDELGDISETEQAFLQNELSGPSISPEDLGREVEHALRVDAYVVSLMTIKIDTEEEANYLRSFASAVDISEAERNEIHDNLDLPRI